MKSLFLCPKPLGCKLVDFEGGKIYGTDVSPHRATGVGAAGHHHAGSVRFRDSQATGYLWGECAGRGIEKKPAGRFS